MKALGIVRKLDRLGRVVIPKELRKSLSIKEGDSMEVFMDGDKVVLQKYQSSCIFCKNADDLIDMEDKKVCRNCINEMSKLI